MLGLWTWGRAVKKVPGGSVTKDGSVSRASRETVLNAQGCCPVKAGDRGIHPTLGGHRREVFPHCAVGGMLAKAIGLASSPATPEGNSKCLITNHLDRVRFFSSGFWHSPYVLWYFGLSGIRWGCGGPCEGGCYSFWQRGSCSLVECCLHWAGVGRKVRMMENL